jgi:hypothetical protein
MKNTVWRAWVFRIIVAAMAGLIIYSFFTPWWTINVQIDPDSGALPQVPDVVRIYAYGLRSELTQNENMVEPFLTPPYQTVAAYVFLGVSLLLILFSTWLRGVKGQLLLGISGLVYIGYGLGFFLMLKKGLDSMSGIVWPMQGQFYIQASLITTDLKPALAYLVIAGGALVLLALLRPAVAPSLNK